MENENIKTAVSRRSFVLGMSAAGTGFVFGLFPSIPGSSALADNKEAGIASLSPGVYLEIKTDGSVIITNPRSEMGQGTRTSLPMILADELDADWAKVTVVQAQGDSKYGSQSTGGSTSIRTFFGAFRQLGATAKAMLIKAAAQTWGIPESGCRADSGFVFETNGSRKLSFGELVDKASALPVPPANTLTLKTKAQFKIIGTDKAHVDNPDIVSGKAIYGMDKKIPGMKYAALAMRPAFGSSVKSFNDTETLKIKGVIRTFQISEGVAVIADNTWSALKGVEALKVEWNMGANANLNSEQIYNSLTSKIGTLPALPANTDKPLNVVYEVPFLAHMTMETMNSTASFANGKLEIWSSTQDPQSLRNSVASSLGMNVSDVTVNMTLTGGGFGRRLSADYALIAAKIAKGTGIPVKAMYTRTDDIRHDNYRPASIHCMKGGIDVSGNVTAFIHKSIYAGNGSPMNPYYNVPNLQLLDDSGISVIPTGAWRSVDNTQVVFANECFIDELAVLAGKDPIEYRLKYMTDSRLKAVLNLLKDKSEWTKPLPKGWGRGVALFIGYSAYAGHVVEVSVDSQGKLKVERIVAVCDPGLAINPRNIEAQFMGASNDGLSTAIKNEITIDKGGVVQSSFMDNDWIRINEVPKFEMHIINERDTPSGMGEVGFPSVTPALVNAISNATGIRVRSLPIRKHKLTTSADEKKNESEGRIRIYPVPVEDKFTVEFDSAILNGMSYSVIISNILGTKIFESTLLSPEQVNEKRIFPFPSVSDGVYFITVKSGINEFTSKIIKQ
jgi:CO/xanthine dehydrogenase Mo-binding subunit